MLLSFFAYFATEPYDSVLGTNEYIYSSMAYRQPQLQTVWTLRVWCYCFL